MTGKLTNLEQQRFKRSLKEILPHLAGLQQYGISMEELEEELEKMFVLAQAEQSFHDFDGRLSWVDHLFYYWLMREKKIPSDIAHSFRGPFYDYRLKDYEDKKERQEHQEKEILEFPGKIR